MGDSPAGTNASGPPDRTVPAKLLVVPRSMPMMISGAAASEAIGPRNELRTSENSSNAKYAGGLPPAPQGEKATASDAVAFSPWGLGFLTPAGSGAEPQAFPPSPLCSSPRLRPASGDGDDVSRHEIALAEAKKGRQGAHPFRPAQAP